ncbi:MAG: bifunctional adenosylcobinamide kinase/adenosylcobinamide-phosphate guanylyltransferase [Pseudomonadota bacterium]|nr:bifunctional adenosylcobinamide kinase/adenosylcobinamide-phosphate guanylyltransferase [Pseudomonadota bacterium]
MTVFSVTRSEFILGGQKSGKSRRAEMLARAWLQQSPAHDAVLIATAQPWDEEMRQRIARHQQDRAERVPGLRTLEEPLQLAQALAGSSRPHTLVVVDCLTLWLTNWLMPAEPLSKDGQPEQPDEQADAQARRSPANASPAQIALLLKAIENATGPVVLVGNEIGLGVIPLGRETRAFVDALGQLNQAVAQACERVTLMAAGLPLTLKGRHDAGV